VRGLSPDQILRSAGSVDATGIDAVCLLATDMQTFPIIDRLERQIGCPVVTSNQALLWASLRALGITAPMPGFGKLLYL
jgi:maleate isomerase